MLRAHVLSALAALLALAPLAAGQCYRQKLLNSDGAAHDAFGNGLVIDGDVALLSAAGNDVAYPDGGQLYRWRRIAGTWVEQDSVLPEPGTQGMGSPLALCGRWIAAGAPSDDETIGGSPPASSAPARSSRAAPSRSTCTTGRRSRRWCS